MKNARWFGLSILACILILPLQSIAKDKVIEKKLEKAFLAKELSGLHSVLIIHRGDILAEKYFLGEDEAWGTPLGKVQANANSLHDLRSVSKNITSLLYGIALSEGLVPKLDDSLIEQFPNYTELLADPQRQKILVRHVLSMQMGIQWNEDLPYSNPLNSEIAMENAKDRYHYVLSRPMVDEPGTKWVYNGGATALIAGLITKGTGKSIDVYAKEKLFAPLGIETFEWVSGKDGVPVAASGLRLNIHDLAKIGTLIINNGTWEGKQIVPADWLKASLTPHAVGWDGLRYGYFWWLAPRGEPPYWLAGLGNGGQRLFVDQYNKLVVVVFAGNYNQPNAWRLPVKVIHEFVLPIVLSR